ncbi:MAG: L,D-transpeptidase [Lachnospiraceae bacterium]|nr:L,D-transpeptidase [Lachnospiraceae bacterium]
MSNRHTKNETVPVRVRGRFWLMLLGAMLLALYVGMASYFRSNFLPNTWFEGIYCTGSSVEAVASQLNKAAQAPLFLVRFSGGEKRTIDLSKVGYAYDYLEEVQLSLAQQNPYIWPLTLFRRTDLTPTPRFTFDETLLTSAWNGIDLVERELSEPPVYRITYSPEDGYALENTKLHRFDTLRALETLKDAVRRGAEEVTFGEGYYADVKMTDAEVETRSLWRELNWFLNCDLVYDMGAEQIPFTPGVMSRFLEARDGLPVLDEYGRLVVKEEEIDGFVDDLCKAYDTYEKVRQFHATRGDVVEIDGGTYGTLLDGSAEKKFLREALSNASFHDGTQDLHVPSYEREGYVRGRNDIGGTYIEVDMTNQKLYAYVDGAIILTSDVVTGNHGKNTPVGTHYIYFKQKNRVLVGENYRTPVKYWMAIINHVGLHDATWRKKFGGDIYLTNGSHGCVNLPLEVAQKLYDTYEEGTPVVVFF